MYYIDDGDDDDDDDDDFEVLTITYVWENPLRKLVL